jgi:nitroreductase
MAEKNLIAWNVDAGDYPSSGEMDEKLKFLLRYAVLAPSGPNNQPWKLAVDGNKPDHRSRALRSGLRC